MEKDSRAQKILNPKGARATSKYQTLWTYIQQTGKSEITMTFAEIGQIVGVPLDHSFLQYKKELLPYGYEVKKISIKTQTVLFLKKEAEDG